ncbi:membrane protein PM19L-like [Populus alba x Populus x berolinensis]|uniref:AWPM-19-like family protein n=1 Tax=Populus davidiana TaxID=266767 RepID=A0A6M2EUL7_9ROSI|nr:membrane protein PM19L-like [Populus alba x Populus x berolinensis]
MASGASKPTAFMLLILNMGLYFFMIIISSWIINHGIVRSRESAAILTIPARIFPIYFPMGNLATGFFVILSLLAGVVGFTSSVTGLYNLFLWNAPSIHATYASSLASLSLTLLAMGFACKEINIGWTDSVLRTLEVVTIIVSGTQLLCTVAIHA